MQEQDHGASELAAGDVEDRPEGKPGWLDLARSRRERMGSVILRAATVLLDMLAWWPEAAVAGQTCLVALQVRQGTERNYNEQITTN